MLSCQVFQARYRLWTATYLHDLSDSLPDIWRPALQIRLSVSDHLRRISFHRGLLARFLGQERAVRIIFPRMFRLHSLTSTGLIKNLELLRPAWSFLLRIQMRRAAIIMHQGKQWRMCSYYNLECFYWIKNGSRGVVFENLILLATKL